MAHHARVLTVLIALLLVPPLPWAEASPVMMNGPSTVPANTPATYEVLIPQYAIPPFTVTWSASDSSPQTVIVNGYSASHTVSWTTPGSKWILVEVQNVGYASIDVNVANGTTQPPAAGIYPAILNWGTTGSAPQPQNVYVTYSGPGMISWTANPSAPWISVSPSMGTLGSTPAKVSVYVSIQGLSAGTYTGSITFSSNGYTVGTVNVNLSIYSQTSDQPPFGDFETPRNGSTVSGSIPVTGWALDDAGIAGVKIYREDGSNLIYIGDAVFVEGARPDLEAAYPQYPQNHRAGWGYMLLTNFLPNGGNGTFTLHAVAKDTNGSSTVLGSKTIICDNAHAVKPFGAIDTPGPNGTASGSSFINWGWALTPQPNTIPTDGTTLNVYVDGVNLGHPTYNVYRSDIASLFPGYGNSNGAVGSFSLNTLAYQNGLHTIQWVATDSGGNTDGIGSRYFSIQNTSNDVQAMEQVGGGSEGTMMPHVEQLSPVSYNMGSESILSIDVGALLGISGGTYTGFSLHDGVLGPLPVGSTLNKTEGTFSWQPGPAFSGQFHLRFFHTSADNAQVSMDVTITRDLNTGVVPPEGTLGTEMTITGSGFGSKKNKVLLDKTSLKVLEWTDGMIRCTVPKAMPPGTYDVTIQPWRASSIILGHAFDVAIPEIGLVNPIESPANTEITIQGLFFGTKKGKVTLGGENCRVTAWGMYPVNGESEIKAVIPRKLIPGIHELKVTNGVGSASVNFNVEEPS